MKEKKERKEREFKDRVKERDKCLWYRGLKMCCVRGYKIVE